MYRMICLLALFATLPVFAADDGWATCFPRRGNCFDAEVNGMTVTALNDPKLAASLERLDHHASDLAWQVPKPLSTRDALLVVTQVNAAGKVHMGERVTEETMVIPLDGQSLSSSAQTTPEDSVRIEGAPALVEKNLLTDRHLAPGRYLLRIKYSGSENWDRKTALLEVRD
ncbi:hypothetical protein GCM10009105_11210 [Dokdonella soli]|uniref:Uncharacterized protein n=2 Tax=Dokdonella soli TaxID=529810 RepID=A0ABN1IE74_9GAMM